MNSQNITNLRNLELKIFKTSFDFKIKMNPVYSTHTENDVQKLKYELETLEQLEIIKENLIFPLLV